MNIQDLTSLVCPLTLKPLELTVFSQKGDIVINGLLENKEAGSSYEIKNGIVNFTHPKELVGLDKNFNEKYEENAKLYEEGMEWLFSSFYETEDDVRNKLVDLLELKPNSFVLNMGCGAGGDSKYILNHLTKGKLFHLDLTNGLLEIARKNIKSNEIPLSFFEGNGSYLPFPDDTFDSVFHFGGINVFSEKKRAIQEMVRVTKPNGRIVFGDESAAPWLSNKKFGKVIKNANPLYKHKPPMHLLPSNAQNVSLSYLLGNSFYAISFNVGSEAKLNLDLPIPGKRGGTLRTRYENK